LLPELIFKDRCYVSQWQRFFRCCDTAQLYGYQGSAWGHGLYGVIRVDKDGLIQQNVAAADLATGILVTLEPGDFLITCFQSDRTALGTAYAANADFAVGQTVAIVNHPELAYK
jgi:hypothetical protein